MNIQLARLIVLIHARELVALVQKDSWGTHSKHINRNYSVLKEEIMLRFCILVGQAVQTRAFIIVLGKLYKPQ